MVKKIEQKGKVSQKGSLMKDGNITTHKSCNSVMERQLNHIGLESNTVSAASTFSPPGFVQRELQQVKRIQKILGPYLSQTMNSVSAIRQNFPQSSNGYFPFPVNVLECSMVPEEKEGPGVQPQKSKESPKLISLSTRYAPTH